MLSPNFPVFVDLFYLFLQFHFDITWLYLLVLMFSELLNITTLLLFLQLFHMHLVWISIYLTTELWLFLLVLEMSSTLLEIPLSLSGRVRIFFLLTFRAIVFAAAIAATATLWLRLAGERDRAMTLSIEGRKRCALESWVILSLVSLVLVAMVLVAPRSLRSWECRAKLGAIPWSSLLRFRTVDAVATSVLIAAETLFTCRVFCRLTASQLQGYKIEHQWDNLLLDLLRE